MKSDDILRDADLSDDRRYRYLLKRLWDVTLPRLHIIGLNPSTADENHDDPTVRRCIGFARRLGYGSLALTNLFAYRATVPADMRAQDDPVGPLCSFRIFEQLYDAPMTIAAWGTHGAFRDRHDEVTAMIREHALVVDVMERRETASKGTHCFGKTKDGFPRHPLFLRNDAALVPYP